MGSRTSKSQCSYSPKHAGTFSPPEEQAQIVCEIRSALSKVDRQVALLETSGPAASRHALWTDFRRRDGQIDVRNYRPQEATAVCQ